jgi:hypothetical protein
MTKVKRAGGVALAVEGLPSKCKALSSNSVSSKKKKKWEGIRSWPGEGHEGYPGKRGGAGRVW